MIRVQVVMQCVVMTILGLQMNASECRAQSVELTKSIDGTEDRFFLAANEGALIRDATGFKNSNPLYAPDLDHNWLQKAGSPTSGKELQINRFDTLAEGYILRDLDIAKRWNLDASRSRYAHCDFIYRLDAMDTVFGSEPLFQIEYILKMRSDANGETVNVSYDSVSISARDYEAYLLSNPIDERQILTFPDNRYQTMSHPIFPRQYAVVARLEPTHIEQLPGYSLAGIECRVKRLYPAVLYVRGLRVRSDDARSRPDTIPVSHLPARLRME